jgi:hypothetical protein
MGRLLDILERHIKDSRGRAADRGVCEKSDLTEGRQGFSRFSRFSRSLHLLTTAFEILERRCPDHVDADRWRQAVEDGRRFLIEWGEQADALGGQWTICSACTNPLSRRPRPIGA